MDHLYEVFSTRWDDPHVVDRIPASDLEFSMPLSEHGECSFSATVPPGWSSWRSSITQYLSGVLITRDTVPVWQGWVIEDREAGPRTFTFRAIEWGYFFASTPPALVIYTEQEAATVFRDLVDRAQSVVGQDVQVRTDSTGAAAIKRTWGGHAVSAWDDTTVEREFRRLAEAEDGPEWYFGTTGTLEAPVRQLYLGDRLGNTDDPPVLEYVEDTAPATGPDGIPTVGLLGDLFPGSAPIVPTRRAGGNVIAKARTRQAESATVAVALGSGNDSARLSRSAVATTLIAQGWPRITRTQSYSDETNAGALQGHANADLAASRGFTTGYSLVTLDDDPDWTQVPRGSTVRASLDTDIYAGPRPLELNTRLLNLTVRVPDTGAAQLQWDTATVQET